MVLYMYIFLYKVPAIEQQPMHPVGYQLVQDQSGQFFLLPQNSITGKKN